MLTVFSELFIVKRSFRHRHVRMYERRRKQKSSSQFSVSIQFNVIPQHFGCNCQETQVVDYKTVATSVQYDKLKVVYRATVTGTRSVHRQSRSVAGMCHCNGLWPGIRPRRPRAIASKMASACRRFVMWRSVFLFFGTISLV